MRPARLWFPLLATLAGPLAAQQPVIGLVRRIRDSVPVTQADVLVGNRKATTNADGRFRIDSLAPGTYPITIRAIGFRPVRSRIAVVASEPTEAYYFLLPATLMLPTIVVEGNRGGIFGKVGDTAFKALPGARVTLLGNSGSEVVTDSLGGFDFPRLGNGAYMLRVTKPGYTERRISVELRGSKGKEFSFLLTPELRPRFNPGEGAALFDLGRRLALGFRNERMVATELERYGSLSVCDVPRVASVIGRDQVGVLNGNTLLLPGQICSWTMDEIELVEFLPGTTRRRLGQVTRGAGTVIIWEKR